MDGYIAQRRGRFYAVIYAGLDPVTGRERRTWHPAGTNRAAAERLAERLAAEKRGRADAVRSLTFGAYLTGQWLPGKKLQLAASTYRGYERNVQRHILPTLGQSPRAPPGTIYPAITPPADPKRPLCVPDLECTPPHSALPLQSQWLARCTQRCPRHRADATVDS